MKDDACGAHVFSKCTSHQGTVCSKTSLPETWLIKIKNKKAGTSCLTSAKNSRNTVTYITKVCPKMHSKLEQVLSTWFNSNSMCETHELRWIFITGHEISPAHCTVIDYGALFERQSAARESRWGGSGDLTSSNPGDVAEAQGCKCVASTLDTAWQRTRERMQLTEGWKQKDNKKNAWRSSNFWVKKGMHYNMKTGCFKGNWVYRKQQQQQQHNIQNKI